MKIIFIFIAVQLASATFIIGMVLAPVPDGSDASCAEPLQLRSGSAGVLRFTEASNGLPDSGDYNYIAFEDFNKDDQVDIAFGGEDWTYTDTVGLYAYTGDGGSSWSDASNGLTTKNSWGGIAFADADADGSTELYAADEHWGSSTNSGVNVWEYRSGSWTDSQLYVSSPMNVGQPNNVKVLDITGDDAPDIVICERTGLAYFENGGGNPVRWQERSDGLPTTREFTGVDIADINADGLMDIVSADYTGGEYIFIQSASGDLWNDYSSTLVSGGITMGVAIGDVNDDSNMDFVFGTGDRGLSCWLGNGGGGSKTDFIWTNASASLPTSGSYNQIQLFDIDIDGDLDIIAPEGGGVGLQIYLGNGNEDPGMDLAWLRAANTNLPDTGSWFGSNCYDINNDGAPDIVAASWGMGIRVYLNDIKKEIEQFDLRVTEDNVGFSIDPAIEGEMLTVQITFSNVGSGQADDFDVNIYIDDILLGRAEQIEHLGAGDSDSVTRTWNATDAGMHQLKVELIPSDPRFEYDPQDNAIVLNFKVENRAHADDGNDGVILGDGIIVLLVVIILVIVLTLFVLVNKYKKKN